MRFLVIPLLLAGCATANQTHLPSGDVGYSIDCSGEALNWGKCQEKAGEICGSRGYEVVSRESDQGASVAATQTTLYGSEVITRTMLISCND